MQMERGIRQSVAFERAMVMFYENMRAALVEGTPKNEGDTELFTGIQNDHTVVGDEKPHEDAMLTMRRSGFMEFYTSWKRFGIITSFNFAGSTTWIKEVDGGWGDDNDASTVNRKSAWLKESIMTSPMYQGDVLYAPVFGGSSEGFPPFVADTGTQPYGWDGKSGLKFVSPVAIAYYKRLAEDASNYTKDYKYLVEIRGSSKFKGKNVEYKLKSAQSALWTAIIDARNKLSIPSIAAESAQWKTGKDPYSTNGYWYRSKTHNIKEELKGGWGTQYAFDSDAELEKMANYVLADQEVEAEWQFGTMAGYELYQVPREGRAWAALDNHRNGFVPMVFPGRTSRHWFTGKVTGTEVGTAGAVLGAGASPQAPEGAENSEWWAQWVPRISYDSVEQSFEQVIDSAARRLKFEVSDDTYTKLSDGDPSTAPDLHEGSYPTAGVWLKENVTNTLVHRATTGGNRLSDTDGDVLAAYELILSFWGASKTVKDVDAPGVADTADETRNAGLAPKPLRKEKALKPLDLQCFLIENIREIAGHKETYMENNPQRTLSPPGNGYKSLITVKSTLQPGSAVSYINGGSPSGTAARKKILNLCPEVYALLSPSIKIWRLDYPSANDSTGKRTPFGSPKLTPIPFSNFLSKGDVAQIGTGALGRIPGAGIKSFTWNLDGVQPAEVENNISANLTIYFQSMYDLFRYNMKDGRPQAGIPDRAGYLDLIIGSRGPASESDANPGDVNDPETELDPCLYRHEAYDGVDFRILVDVGWSVPDGLSNIPGVSNVEALQEALLTTRTALELQITRHELNFEQDGSLELSIDYQASLSGLMKTPHANIFAKSSTEAAAGKANFETLIKEIEDANPDMENAPPAVRQNYEELLKQKEDTEKDDKIEKYHKFLNQLYKKNKIYTVMVDPKELLLQPWDELSPEARAARAKRKQSTVPGRRGYTTPGRLQDPGGAFGLVNELAELHGQDKAAIQERLKEYETELGEEYEWLSANAEDLQDYLSVPYFYLGDLIDMVLDYTGITKDNTMKIVAGAVELIDPLVLFQVKSVDMRTGGNCPVQTKNVVRALSKIDPLRFRRINKITSNISIGSIPISLDAFNAWFVQHVIRPLRDDYYLLHFIKDVCADLIGNAYGAACFGSDFVFDLRFDTAMFNLSEDAFPDGGWGTTVNYSKLADNKYKVDAGKYHTAVSRWARNIQAKKLKTTPTVLLYCTDSRPSFAGSEASDRKRGIYHYYLGASCGLLKTVNFSRSDQPYLREAKIQKKGALGAEQLRELYEINMDMIGNTLHRNGQFIYFNPVAVGGGNPGARGTLANWARVLGFGGYFLVQKVSHTIDSSGFSVSVNGLQQAVQLERNNGHAGLGVTMWRVEEESSPSHMPGDSTAAVEEYAETTAITEGTQLGEGIGISDEDLAKVLENPEMAPVIELALDERFPGDDPHLDLRDLSDEQVEWYLIHLEVEGLEDTQEYFLVLDEDRRRRTNSYDTPNTLRREREAAAADAAAAADSLEKRSEYVSKAVVSVVEVDGEDVVMTKIAHDY
jgi:hypothetical protein